MSLQELFMLDPPRLSFFSSLFPGRCSIQSPKVSASDAMSSEPSSRGNVSGYCRNLGSLRDGNETWRRLPCSLLRSTALFVQSEDSELMPPRWRII